MKQARLRSVGKFLILSVFHISQKEDVVLALARHELDLNTMGRDRTPSMSNAVTRLAGNDILRITELIIQAYERLSVSVEAINRRIDTIERIMVAAFLIFCLMIYYRAIHLDLSGREITLEVLHVGSCIPQAPFRKRE